MAVAALKIEPDIDMFDRFFEYIATEENVAFRTFSDAENGHPGPKKFYGQPLDFVNRLSHENAQGAGVFWVVNPTDGKDQKDANIVGVRSLFLDLDGAPLDPVLREEALPHVIIETSPGKHHAYYLITAGFPTTEFSRYQKALALRFQGDIAVNNLSRVMRVPGFYHVKNRNTPFQSRIVSMREEVPYVPQELASALRLDFSKIENYSSPTNRHLCVVPGKNDDGIIKNHTRNVTLFSRGARFRNAGADYDDLLAWLIKTNETKCETPLPQKEIETIARQLSNMDSYELSRAIKTGENFGFGAPERQSSSQPISKSGKKDPLSGIITGDELAVKEIPPIKWAVPDVLPQGLTVLAGAPKLGKSLLIQQISIAVALGGPAIGKFPAIQGSVLHLALEDPESRFKERMLRQQKLFTDGVGPKSLCFCNNWSFLPDALDDVRRWCEMTPDRRLVVVDTLAKLFEEDDDGKRKSVYYSEYAVMGKFQVLAREMGVSVVIVHHLRKADAGDPMMKVSGSAGLTGAADMVWVFERKNRNAMQAKVQSMGKDLPDVVYRLNYDEEHLSWVCEDFGSEDNNTAIRKLIMDFFESNGNIEATASEVADKIRRHRQHVSSNLKSLEADGFLSRRKAIGNNMVFYHINQEVFQ